MLHGRGSGDAPSFLYYLAPEQLAAEAGQGLVVLAEGTTANRGRLLSEAIEALSGAVSVLAAPDPAQGGPAYPRSALLHTTFLARAYLLRGELAEAVTAMRVGLDLLAQVQSPRGGTTCGGCGLRWPAGPVPAWSESSYRSSMRHYRLYDDRSQ